MKDLTPNCPYCGQPSYLVTGKEVSRTGQTCTASRFTCALRVMPMWAATRAQQSRLAAWLMLSYESGSCEPMTPLTLSGRPDLSDARLKTRNTRKAWPVADDTSGWPS